MFGKSGVYARSVFLKAHFFGQPFKVLKVDKTLVDYYTKPVSYTHLDVYKRQVVSILSMLKSDFSTFISRSASSRR